MKRLPALLALLVALSGCAGFGTRQRLAPNVDLSRYAGRWYIIAEIPYFAERGNVASYFDVSFPHGHVRDVYHGLSGGFSGKPTRFVMHGYVVKGRHGAYWRESPFWPLYLSYLILYVGPHYGTALVGYPGRDYGWVLSRHRRMDDADLHALLARFAAEGYDPAKFRRVPQVPADGGAP